jgi:hypothetical protein
MSPNGVQPPDDLSAGEARKIGVYSGLIALLVLLAGGVALRAYYAVRYPEHVGWPSTEWWVWLVVFSGGGGVVVGTVATAWRLIHRRRRQPHWGTAMVVLVVVLFGLLVWPTPWTYRQYGCDVLQINRFIGRISVIAKIPACEAVSTAGTVTD